MRKILLLFMLIYIPFPSICFSAKNDERAISHPYDISENLQDIRDISLEYSSSINRIGALRIEINKIAGSLTSIEELYYLKETVNAINLTIAVSGYQKLMLYQYPDLKSDNNIHQTTLIMSLDNTSRYLEKYSAIINYTVNSYIQNEEFKMLIEECLIEIEKLKRLTKESEDIIQKHP